jgi:hypothetical protein
MPNLSATSALRSWSNDWNLSFSKPPVMRLVGQLAIICCPPPVEDVNGRDFTIGEFASEVPGVDHYPLRRRIPVLTNLSR